MLVSVFSEPFGYFDDARHAAIGREVELAGIEHAPFASLACRFFEYVAAQFCSWRQFHCVGSDAVTLWNEASAGPSPAVCSLPVMRGCRCQVHLAPAHANGRPFGVMPAPRA